MNMQHNGTPPPQKLPIMPCGRCGGPATQDIGVGSSRMEPPARFRCRDRHCLIGPQVPQSEAIHAWNRVSQGWVALDVLVSQARNIPGMAEKITEAMQGHFDTITKAYEESLKLKP